VWYWWAAAAHQPLQAAAPDCGSNMCLYAIVPLVMHGACNVLARLGSWEKIIIPLLTALITVILFVCVSALVCHGVVYLFMVLSICSRYTDKQHQR
jgi:hypothetical protein